ncbi:TMEM175 family protein [Flavobacterium sp. IMCC34518]|uniref:TMEM175 family protein n=1 Tax=Flavobacterium sp. IMCC34518 TaxID=3003623 RepID=UPI0022AC4471|nr:TMEM175 family protein [Flavobacterium sp. IMCC34518]
MNKNRIEAFSDGVIAIIVTIMVLELHIPELKENFTNQDVWNNLFQLIPKLLAYLLSFIVVAIFWVNHHSLFDKLPYSNSKLVWYNAFLLFAMSLIPLPTAFLAEHFHLYQASMFYGFVMFLNAFAFLLLRRYVEVKVKLITYNALVHRSNLISTSLYLLSIPLALVSVYLSFIIFVGIPVWYFLPDKYNRKIEMYTNLNSNVHFLRTNIQKALHL